MNDTWLGYFNQKVLYAMNRLHPGRLAFLRFIPDPEEGMVIMVPGTDENEYGAVPLQYYQTENRARVNLRRALIRMKVPRLPGRIRVFPLVTRTAPNGKTYFALVVKEHTTRPNRKAKSGGAA